MNLLVTIDDDVLLRFISRGKEDLAVKVWSSLGRDFAQALEETVAVRAKNRGQDKLLGPALRAESEKMADPA